MFDILLVNSSIKTFRINTSCCINLSKLNYSNNNSVVVIINI